MFYLIAILSGTLGAMADAFLNHWAKKGGDWLALGVGYALWNASLFLFVYLLRSGGLAQVVILFLVANSVAILLLSKFYFLERISIQQWVGIFVAILGVLIMELRSA